MRYLRYNLRGEEPQFGWMFEDQIGPVEGSIFGEYRRLEADIPPQKAHLLSPVIPTKIIGVLGNYLDTSQAEISELSQVPQLFLKPPSTVVGQGRTVILPPQGRQVMAEIHLAAVIGKTGRWIQSENAQSHVFGYTIAIDFTARDIQLSDGNPVRAKSFDTFLALGPWIETDLNTLDVILSAKVDSELCQMASTREMIFTVDRIIAFISSFLTLSPGDVILTGTPPGARMVTDGSQVEAKIEEIGSLVVMVSKG